MTESKDSSNCKVTYPGYVVRTSIKILDREDGKYLKISAFNHKECDKSPDMNNYLSRKDLVNDKKLAFTSGAFNILKIDYKLHKKYLADTIHTFDVSCYTTKFHAYGPGNEDCIRTYEASINMGMLLINSDGEMRIWLNSSHINGVNNTDVYQIMIKLDSKLNPVQELCKELEMIREEQKKDKEEIALLRERVKKLEELKSN